MHDWAPAAASMRPGYRVTNLWRTAPSDNVGTPDSIAAHQGVLPPAGGTVVRIIEWPPEPHQGDVLIQRGTAHAWANRSGKAVKVAFVLVDSSRSA